MIKRGFIVVVFVGKYVSINSFMLSVNSSYAESIGKESKKFQFLFFSELESECMPSCVIGLDSKVTGLDTFFRFGLVYVKKQKTGR